MLVCLFNLLIFNVNKVRLQFRLHTNLTRIRKQEVGVS